MPLQVSSNPSGSGQGGQGYMGDGIFIDEAVILEVVNRSGTKAGPNQQWSNDLQVEVKMRLLKNDWERTVNVGGNFKVDEQGEVDWGSAFKVRNFFEACNALNEKVLGDKKELNTALTSMEGGEISPVLLSFCIGKTVKILSYKKADGKSATWNQIVHHKRDDQKFKDYFLRQFDKGYVKNYAPDAAPNRTNSTGNATSNASAIDLTGPWDKENTTTSGSTKLDEF